MALSCCSIEDGNLKTILSGGKSGVSVRLSVSLSFPHSLFVSFIFFLPLTATQRGAISHSAQRDLEELKATEQKKNRKTESRKETGELGVGRDGRRGEGCEGRRGGERC